VPSRGLPENIDPAYADDATHPDVKIHQQHHDTVHEFVNLFDDGVPPDGAVFFWNDSTQLWTAIDPEIEGSPGPQGETGVGFVYLGDWDSGTTYHQVSVNDQYELVRDGGTIFLCLLTNSNSEPDTSPADTANWEVFAPAGTDGADGVDGTQGDTGPIGQTGPPGPSQEALISLTSVSGAVTLDAGEASYYAITLTGNATITLEDTSGRPVSAITIRLTQGGSGTNIVTWANTSWALTDGIPPVLGTAVDDLNVVSFDQVNGVWIGYAPGAGTSDEPPIIVPPPDVWLTLDLVPWTQATAIDSSARAGINTYIMGASTQLGNKIGGIVDIVTTVDNSIAPPVPSLAGGGVVTWTLIATVVDTQVATTRRRLTRYAARDAISAAAGPFTVGLPDAAANHSGCVIRGVKSAAIVQPTFVSLALANSVTRLSTSAGQTGAAVNGLSLAAAQDAADRTLMVVADSASSTVTFGPVEAGYSLIGTQQSMTAPTIHVNELWNPTDYDTTPTTAFTGGSAIWLAIASEMEQPGAFTPPPAGIPTIAVEAVLLGFDTTDQTADYDTTTLTASVGNGAAVLIGNNRMAICDVITTTGTSVDPGVPTLTGGSITTWSNEGSVILGTSTNRSRLTRFIGWQATAGAAAPLIVGVSGQASTGIQIQLVRTPTTDATVFALAQSTTKTRRYLDASEVAGGPAGLANDALASPGGGSIVYALAAWNSSLATLGTITPEATLTTVASTGMGSAPARQMHSMVSAVGSYDQTPSVTWNGTALNWGFIATELGQAV
jgi:hypothetical protein